MMYWALHSSETSTAVSSTCHVCCCMLSNVVTFRVKTKFKLSVEIVRDDRGVFFYSVSQ